MATESGQYFDIMNDDADTNASLSSSSSSDEDSPTEQQLTVAPDGSATPTTTTANPLPLRTLVVSLDIEADGPSPSVSSLRMLGVCAIDAALVDRADPTSVARAIVSQREWCVAPQSDRQAYAHTMQWFRKQGNLLPYIEAHQRPVKVVMLEFIAWLKALKQKWNIEWVAKPSWYDRMWIEELFHLYAPPDVSHDFLGHRVTDITTVLRTVSWLQPHIPYEKIENMFNPFGLPHTHYASADALEQGITFCLARQFLKALGRAKRSGAFRPPARVPSPPHISASAKVISGTLSTQRDSLFYERPVPFNFCNGPQPHAESHKKQDGTVYDW